MDSRLMAVFLLVAVSMVATNPVKEINKTGDLWYGPTCNVGCGGRAPAGCYCDKCCVIRGDCCDDYIPKCTGGYSGCSFDGCGGFSYSALCWCDNYCRYFGDCCRDYERTCYPGEALADVRPTKDRRPYPRCSQ